MEKENVTFQYTYSAGEQEEIQRIREKYSPKEPDKMEQIRRLDRSVTVKGTKWSLLLGTIGTLILGIGMSCTLAGTSGMFAPGIFIGVTGMVLVALAYPVYVSITKKEKKKVAPEILRLLDEIEK